MKILYSDGLLDLLVRQGAMSEKQRKFVSLEKGKRRQKLLKNQDDRSAGLGTLAEAFAFACQ